MASSGSRRNRDRELPSQFLMKDVAAELEHATHLKSLHDDEARRKELTKQRLHAKLEHVKNDFRNENWTSIRKKLVDIKDLWEAEFDRATDLSTKLEEVRTQLSHEEAVRGIMEDALSRATKLNGVHRGLWEDACRQVDDTEDKVRELTEQLRRSEAVREAQEIRRNEERIAATNPRNTHECNICCNTDSNALFPCGNVFCCMPCALGIRILEGKDCASCPVCRTDGPFKRIYFS